MVNGSPSKVVGSKHVKVEDAESEKQKKLQNKGIHVYLYQFFHLYDLLERLITPKILCNFHKKELKILQNPQISMKISKSSQTLGNPKKILGIFENPKKSQKPCLTSCTNTHKLH